MVVNPQSTPFFAKRESGGKGYNLYLMSKAGLPVPDWVIFGTRYFSNFLLENNLSDKIQQSLNEFRQDVVSAADLEKHVACLFADAPATSYLSTSLHETLIGIGADHVFSVRSSAADEDGLAHSFAGQLSSYLYVRGEIDILKFIKHCWASAFSERALIYRKQNNIDPSKISVAVIVQRMIDPDKAGVMFTCDPVRKKLDQFVISSVYGVGEGLVSGALDADSFWLSADSGTLLSQEIVEKTQMMKQSASGHCQLLPVEISIQNESSLTKQELSELFHLGKKIHADCHRPQDIEWAIQGDKIYILQTRPVTTLGLDLVSYPNLWDNSNIIESYGGLTSPLSFSFALRNYRAVYVQFCEILGVPKEIIKDMDSYLSYMLGSINGRVYYNLFNWYKLVGILPGFKQNRQFMETMMGVSESLTEEISGRIKPHPSWDSFSGKIRKLVTGLNFIRYHFTIQRIVNKFLAHFHKDYDYYRSLPLRTLRGDQLVQIYWEMERKMLGRWEAPIINDFLTMVHFGLLRKLTMSWLAALDNTIQNDLLSGEGGLESAEPTRAMIRLAYFAQQTPALSCLIMETDAKDVLEKINQSEFTEFYQKVTEYIDHYGFRCMSEMKLEEIDLHSDPSYLFSNLKNYIKSGKLSLPDDSSEKALRTTAEKKVAAHLRGLKKVFYFWVLKHARKAVKNRENTRFARTRIYGVARTIFQAIGEDLAAQQILNSNRDIFWLTIEEVFGIYSGTLPSHDLQGFVDLRKKSYEKFSEDTDPRIMTRGPVYWSNVFSHEVEVPKYDTNEDCDLKGIPCCPGILEGVVKVIQSPQDDLTLNGEILVTTRTDPGWVPLYPSISGLLVERGSLLSHSAIVAREMGIPAIVSIPGLTKTLKTGMRIRMDGKAGTIKIL